MDSRAKELVEQGNRLFSKRSPLLSLWQEMADNFYPERADFTLSRGLGANFAEHLSTSYPIIARRELGSLISAMLRPTEAEWFRASVADDDTLDYDSQRWLEDRTRIMRRAMYDRAARLVVATKSADNDFVTFGQAVLSVEHSFATNSLLFRSWHLRDVVWCENAMGEIDHVQRKWRCTVKQAAQEFGAGNLHQKMRQHLDAGKDPYTEVTLHHVVMASDGYEGADGKKYRSKYVSLWIDPENEHIVSERGSNHLIYLIPRWQTVSGSQYAYSPCTVAALPDARLIQSMTLTLLEAGEKATNPPIIAQHDVVRSDVNLYSGGLVLVDKDYDERLGEAIRPLGLDTGGIPFGMELRADVKQAIMEAFYLNKINMPPPTGRDMTAYEIGQRVQEYVRNAMPLFEPLEYEYNAQLCDMVFQVMLDAGGFGSYADMPQQLRGRDVMFRFESPLHDTIEKQKGQIFMQTKALLAEAVALDQSAPAMIDASAALRDTLKSIGTPTKWIKSDQAMQEEKQAMAQQQSVNQLLQQMQAGAGVAEQVGLASQALGISGNQQ